MARTWSLIVSRLRGARWAHVVLGIVILGLIFGSLLPTYLDLRNIQNIAVQASVTGVMAVGMTYVIMTSGIDISVGAIVYLSIAVTVALSGATTVPALAYVVAPMAGLLLGLVNGAITTRLGVNPLITTLATLSIYRGMAIHLTQARIEIAPADIRLLGVGSIMGVPVPIIVLGGLAVLAAFSLRHLRYGRYVQAVGASRRSATETGLPVGKVLVLVYGLAGLAAGIGGLILLGRVGAVQSDMGVGIEFTVITAVVLGGTALSGGSGSILGSVAGAVLLVMIDNGLNQLNASPFIYDVVRGSVLAVAVILDRGDSLPALVRATTRWSATRTRRGEAA